ncbi:MAG: hypothetical protein AAB418_08775 [candidate division NC10 bacterium]
MRSPTTARHSGSIPTCRTRTMPSMDFPLMLRAVEIALGVIARTEP